MDWELGYSIIERMSGHCNQRKEKNDEYSVMYRPHDFVLSKERIRPPKKKKGKMSFLDIPSQLWAIKKLKYSSKNFGIASLPYMIDSETISWVFQVSKLYQHYLNCFPMIGCHVKQYNKTMDIINHLLGSCSGRLRTA